MNCKLKILCDSIETMEDIVYTRHAKNRMRWHKITEAEIESAIYHPDFVEHLIEGKTNAWLKVAEKYLRVTYREEQNRIWIITAVKKKKRWR